MRRGQGRKRPLALCVGLALLDAQFRKRQADLFLFYRTLMGQRAPQRLKQHATWYRTVGRYIRDGHAWMDADPLWLQMMAHGKKPALRAKMEPDPDPIEAFYGRQMPVFDGIKSRPAAISVDYVSLLKQIREVQKAGQRFLKDLERQ